MQSLLVQGHRWEILQHLEWMSGRYSFFIQPVSPVEAFHLEIVWLFRPDLAALIGTVRLLDEGDNIRIFFVTKPFPTNEGPDKFLEFFELVQDYFGANIVTEDDAWKPTGWERLDRNISKIRQELFTAKDEEDFQKVGLLCREAITTLAQAVFNPELHKSVDGIAPSETDAKRMLESYIATELSGSSNKDLRKYAKACYDLANHVQHKRTSSYREAALCVEATRSITNTVAIIAEQSEINTSR